MNARIQQSFSLVGKVSRGCATDGGASSEHLQQHRLFIEQVGKLRAKAEHERDETMSELVSFLNSWLYQHILKTDRTLGALLNGQLAQPRG